MASINGVKGKGHAVAREAGRSGTLEMSAADAMHLGLAQAGGEELLYTGPVVTAGLRRMETFPVNVSANVTNTAAPAFVFFEQSGEPRDASP